MITPSLIVRTNRRSLCLSITKKGELVVHAPRRLSMNDLIKYIDEKEKWILSKQKEIQDRLKINTSVINYEEILFMGSKYKIEYVNGLKKIELSNKSILLPNKSDYNIKSHIKTWYVSNAKKIIIERLEYFADIMQIDYASVSLTNSKSRWGSCDKSRNIKLNFRLVMLPHKCIDFVLIHELSHILQFNHSKEFYKIISTIMPNYKLQQKILKEYDYVLELYR